MAQAEKNKLEDLLGRHREIPRREELIHTYRQAIRNFTTLTKAMVIKGSMFLNELFPSYERMSSLLHKKCGDPDVVDITALSYALQRLPEEIATTKEVYIKSNAEDLSQVPGIKVLSSLRQGARRRTMYGTAEGHMQMVAREGVTDIYDIISCLIMYSKEGMKIKEKLLAHKQETGHDLIKRAQELSSVKESEEKNQLMVELSDKFNVDYSRLRSTDRKLDYKLLGIIANLASQRADELRIEFDSEFSRTDDPKKAKKWCNRIKKELEEYKDRPIIIISSDTHSAVNCLTGFAQECKADIAELAKKDDELRKVNAESTNGLYFLSQKLCKSHPELLEKKVSYEQKLGVKFIKDTHNTGIDVQIIDTEKLDLAKVDPRIKMKKKFEKGKAPIILNIDYAFGQEGKDIMDELCDSLGTRIESISITGKAGILCGSLYDIMLPYFIVPQIEGGGVYNMPNGGNQLTKEQLESDYPSHKIHDNGSMLTVPGTAIQNELVLMDYYERYNTLGLEMEAAPYFDSIEKAYARGILRKDIMMNVAYWASDNPLNEAETLEEDHMDQGFEPTYSIMAAILNNVLNYQTEEQDE